MKLSFFTLSVALRHLRHGVGQSLLTIGVVAISVLLIVYLRTVIGGTQIRIVNNVTGAIAHIVLEPAEQRTDRGLAPARIPGPGPLRRRDREPAAGSGHASRTGDSGCRPWRRTPKSPLFHRS